MKLVIEYLPEEDSGDQHSTCFRITGLDSDQRLLTAADLQAEASNLHRQAEEKAKRNQPTQWTMRKRSKPTAGISGTVIKRYLPSREALKGMGYESLDAYLGRTGVPSGKPKREPSEVAQARQKIIEDLHLDFSYLDLKAL